MKKCRLKGIEKIKAYGNLDEKTKSVILEAIRSFFYQI